jgi:asparagine synthase (glutamine-hydrolysing)
MCGICGVFEFSGRPLAASTVAAMAGALRHRGPEATGVMLWPRSGLRRGEGAVIGLGHTRLKIIDLSDGANQPLANEDGSVWVILNGEIYNFIELRDELKSLGHQFRTESDTEAIVHLYEEMGPACVERLDGMFAFAVWDERTRRLFLARDRTGKKPLYWFADCSRFAFGSEIKALLAHPAIPRDIRPEALPLLFIHGYVPSPDTLYAGITQVPPGHSLIVDASGRRDLRRYWDWTFPRHGAASPASEGEAIGRLRELMTAAVRRRLIADVPLGAFLSGGVDSSIIVALMAGLMSQPVKTFSIGFAGDRNFDETRYARLVAARYQTAHTEFIVEPKAFDLLERLVRVYDGPFGDSSAIPTFILSELTRRHVTVALNGDGGDELFAGYLRFGAAIWAARIPSSLFRLGRLATAWLPPAANPRHPLRRTARFFKEADGSWLERFSRWISIFHDDVTDLILPSVAGEVKGLDRIAHFEPHLAQVRDRSRLSQLLYLNAKTYLHDDLLVKMDRASMAHALETRSPFLDRELMEFAAMLPDRFKLRGSITKWILRRAFTDLLPPPILTRGKMGFGVPLATWFRTELKEPLQSLLLSPTARLREYLDAARVRWMVQQHLAWRQSFEHELWLLLTFEVWLQSQRGARVVE